MSDGDLRAVARAARVLSSDRCEIDGEIHDGSSGASAEEQRAWLTDLVYQRLYTRAGPPRPWARDRAAKRDVIRELSAANTGSGTWERGWRIADLGDDGRVAVRRGAGPAFWTPRKKVRLAPGSEWARDARCRVRVDKEIRDLDGFYVAVGDAEAERRPKTSVRLYWNLEPRAVVPWMAAVTSGLNAAGVPFRAKCLHVRESRRADAAVIYLARSSFESSRPLVAEIHRQLAGGLRSAVPLFTFRLARGLGLAEDPRGGESFGQNRSRLVAEALWRAFEEGGEGVEARYAALVAGCREAGLDPERLHLANGDSETVDLPLAAAEPSPTTATPTTTTTTKDRAARPAPIFDEEPRAVAAAIGRDLCREAWWHEDRCNWLGRSARLEAAGCSPAVAGLGADVYDGAAGVALFLAELARTTGDREARRAALGGLRGALARCRRDDVPARGFFDGRLGVAWVALRVAERLGEEEPGRDAAELLAEVVATPHDGPLDLISGNAGAVLALLDLHRRPVPFVAPEPLLPAALRWGEEIVAAADADDAEGRLSWPPARAPKERPGPPMLAGLAHGASGMAWALLELARHTGRDDLRRAGRAAFAYEDSLFDPERGNWPDLRESGRPGSRFTVAWCHGAPGIALARLGAAAADPERAEVHRAVARVALATTARALEKSGDDADTSLCHGVGGYCAVLVHAARVLNEPEWGDRARAALADLAERGAPWPSGTPTRGPNPSLMLGAAGIGMCLLRARSRG